MDATYCVYKHTCPNGKVYIGQTKNYPELRWGKNGYGYRTSPYFYNAIGKYGWDNIKHEILYTGLTEQEAKDMERKLITEYKANDRRYGYNITAGGDGWSGMTLSDEIRENMRNAKRKNQHTVLQIDVDTGDIIAEYNNVSQASRETGVIRASISYVCLGKQRTAGGYYWQYKECPIEYSGCRNEKYNKKSTKKSHKRVHKKVAQIDKDTKEVLNIYESIPVASSITGIPYQGIQHCCTNIKKSCYGYIWKYYE